MPAPHIAVVHTANFPRAMFSEFERLVSHPNLDLQIEERESEGPYAGIEWLIPTAVVLYIGKSYFDGFLKEMGKDHYSLLKSGLKTIYTRLIGSEAPKVTVIATQGKARESQPYSLIYSLMAEAGPNSRFKLLLQSGASQSEYNDTVASFLDFVSSYHAGTLDSHSIESLSNTRAFGGTKLLAYNPKARRIEPVDPMPERGNA